MKKKYTKKQITEAIAYWKKQLKMMNEDANGYMFKLKTPYYNFWKLMRGTVGKLRSVAKRANGHPIRLGRMPQVLNDGTGYMFTNSVKKEYRWVFKKFAEFIDEHQEVITDKEKYPDIIKIRDEFYKWESEKEEQPVD